MISMAEVEHHLMVDTETLGRSARSVIACIGVMAFDQRTRVTVLDQRVDIHGQDREVETETVEWWLKRSDAARREMTRAGRLDLRSSLERLSAVVNERRADGAVAIWAKSPSFDLAILRDAYEQLGMECPWSFREERDVRTVVSMVPEGTCTYPEDSSKAHTVVADCQAQVLHVQTVWNKLGGLS